MYLMIHTTIKVHTTGSHKLRNIFLYESPLLSDYYWHVKLDAIELIHPKKMLEMFIRLSNAHNPFNRTSIYFAKFHEIR